MFGGYFRSRGAPTVTPYQGEAMGTTWSVKAWGKDLPDLQVAISSTIAGVDSAMSTYKPASDVSRFNVYPGTDPFPLSPWTHHVVAASLDLSQRSGGGFDITVGPLVGLWGFGAGALEERPSPEAVEAVVLGWTLLQLGEGTLAKQDAAVQLDLSAIAKGFAVDEVAEALERKGVQSYMVEIGGEVRTAGSKGDDPWRIGIERPQSGSGQVVQGVLELHGALATSGDYRNFVEDDQGRRSHTIDPRTRAPVTHDLASVSVRHELCMMADGWATALNVLGPEEGLRVADEEGLAVLMLVRTEEGFEERTSRAW